ncbi:unnamed protein product [Arabis nemorensis]|uniref:BHLH domain-containing protein n=1 Tax=Arabis nemorensis TaxID=586526 RepID=A0A565CWX1_9BRAS|nr:unnamed protein product [Arabis nemorensis]
MFDRSFPSVYGGAVSSAAGDAVTGIGEDKYAFENKRRRSKINEKMKALQKLIPNSNKTDKASMLDEAIEYLKQLQLQVQTLAVMNGLGLNPMRLPPVLLPTQTRITETLEPELNLETMLGASQSLVHCEPPEASQQLCFGTATLL